jgi:hypothetical protein
MTLETANSVPNCVVCCRSTVNACAAAPFATPVLSTGVQPATATSVAEAGSNWPFEVNSRVTAAPPFWLWPSISEYTSQVFAVPVFT